MFPPDFVNFAPARTGCFGTNDVGMVVGSGATLLIIGLLGGKQHAYAQNKRALAEFFEFAER